MSKERLPEGSGWKDRLGEPDALPEWKIADKEAVWDRLHQRLGNPRRLIGVPWYRIAAAVIFLFTVGLAVFLRERSTDPKPGPGAVKAEPLRPLGPALSKEAYTTTQGHTPAFSVGEMKTVQRIPKQARHATRSRRPSPGYRLDIARLRSTTDSVSIPLLYFMPDPLRVAATNGIGSRTPVAAKPMRILSINELDHPSGPGSSMAGGSVPKRLGVRWNNRGSSDPAPYSEEKYPTDRSSTNTLIKINLSPQN